MAEMSHTEGTPEVSSQANVSESFVALAKKDEKPIYEVGFHVVPTVPEDEVGSVVEKIRQALGDAEIINEHFPQKMKLSYIVERAESGKRDKYSEAYFGFIKFATAREKIGAFEDALRAMKEVLRFLLIETVREEVVKVPRRAVFSSDRLEGETIKKPAVAPEKGGEVSEEELDKSIDALVS